MTNETEPYAGGSPFTTYVQPSGIDFIRKQLGLPTIDPLPAELPAGEAPR